VSARQQVAVAVLGGAVVGHAMATITGGTIELGVVVAECHRKQGLATRMVRDLIGEAVRRGAEALRFDVLCENQLVLEWIRRGLPDTRFERDGHTLTGHAVLDVGALSVPAA
jgi:ribosomal protein S18 acetylase RimI-like enzyme